MCHGVCGCFRGINHQHTILFARVTQVRVKLATGQTSIMNLKPENLCIEEESNEEAADAICVAFATGQRVELHGLASNPELNGAIGTLANLSERTGRWGVELDCGEAVGVKHDNLTLCEEQTSTAVSSGAQSSKFTGPRCSIGGQQTVGSLVFIHAGNTAGSRLDAVPEPQQNMIGKFIARFRATFPARRLELEYLEHNSLIKQQGAHAATMGDLVMSTSIFFATVQLDAAYINQILRAVSPLQKLACSDAPLVFRECLPQLQESGERHSALQLLCYLCCMPGGSNVYVYSETSDEIVAAQQAFQPPPTLLCMDDVPNFASWETPQASSSSKCPTAHLAQRDRCFNCRRSALNHGLCLTKCGQCLVPVYCSKVCQAFDWKTFHKRECTSLREGRASIQEVGLEGDRYQYLNKPNAQRAKLPLDTQNSGVYDGAQVALFLGGDMTFCDRPGFDGRITEEMRRKILPIIGCGLHMYGQNSGGPSSC